MIHLQKTQQKQWVLYIRAMKLPPSVWAAPSMLSRLLKHEQKQ